MFTRISFSGRIIYSRLIKKMYPSFGQIKEVGFVYPCPKAWQPLTRAVQEDRIPYFSWLKAFLMDKENEL